MTVTYMQHVHTAYFATFLKLLTLWRGSILKGVGWNIVIYCCLYYTISFVYKIILSSDENLKNSFEGMCRVIKEHKDVLPLNFILGFYVTQVIGQLGQITYNTLELLIELILELPMEDLKSPKII